MRLTVASVQLFDVSILFSNMLQPICVSLHSQHYFPLTWLTQMFVQNRDDLAQHDPDAVNIAVAPLLALLGISEPGPRRVSPGLSWVMRLQPMLPDLTQLSVFAAAYPLNCAL